MSLNIDYAMKKKRKKMADGGMPDEDNSASEPAPSEPPKKSSEWFAETAKGHNQDKAKSVASSFNSFADGGMCEHGHQGCPMCHGGNMAKGGDVKGVNHPYFKHLEGSKGNKGLSEAGSDVEDARMSPKDEHFERMEKAKEKHQGVLDELHGMKKKDRKYLAEGGEAGSDEEYVKEEEAYGYEDEDIMKEAKHEDDEQRHHDLVQDIMHQRRYSKGGKVSNDTPPDAEFEDNQFDDLVKDDDLEEHYTGKNSGDEIGDEQEDEDRKDIVSAIMKSRKKKDRLPHPM